ncbi:hypothetical protein GKQ77_19375 [Streptomyces sp. BG9H]|uniref:DUF6542 domain-containing protein n=1 Tax=Streptomyces anatolicus TaxID=2675858 RepID=A0ABS6YQI4_9ACTN|nr:DUF6542 domain-containing protein [Streptomyces anatolicus]MBW5423698.1 hypothetical protein [Streptomyces anatolicus]
MEQHRTRPSQSEPKAAAGARPRRTAPLPPQGRAAGSGTVYRAAARPRRPVPPFVRALRRSPLYRRLRQMPNPRLTGLGSGLFCAAVMFLFACLLRLLFGSSLVAYGVLFVPVAALTALWVRPADLVTAPVAVPISFAAGILPISGGTGGFGGQVMGLVTSLALHAGWLYGGTLVAGVIVTVRKARLMTQRRRQPRPAQPRQPGGGKRVPAA